MTSFPDDEPTTRRNDPEETVVVDVEEPHDHTIPLTESELTDLAGTCMPARYLDRLVDRLISEMRRRREQDLTMAEVELLRAAVDELRANWDEEWAAPVIWPLERVLAAYGVRP